MVSVCFYFQVHQPNRLRKYTYFDIGNRHDYEDDEANRAILLKVANKCYLPTTALLLELIKQYNGAFKVSFSLSGVFIDQCKKFCPEVLDSFKRLAETGCVEFLNETYYHSLSFLFSPDEFKEQVMMHRDLIKNEFGYEATTFRNTELIYSNDVAKTVKSMGYKAILAEGAEKVLGWKSANFVYEPQSCESLKLLMRNYQLTDDVAFRFSNQGWPGYPLFAEKYANWVHSLNANAETINLFMDFETFGEHQWADTGIFEFLRYLPREILKHPDYCFMTPAEVSSKIPPKAQIDVPYFLSWADMERDLTAWYGNELQKDALETVYSLEHDVKATGNADLIHAWRTLQTSDHFYYMCTKYANDGDVHKYFNPYHNPYDAYINYQNILTDFIRELEKEKENISRSESFAEVAEFGEPEEFAPAEQEPQDCAKPACACTKKGKKHGILKKIRGVFVA